MSSTCFGQYFAHHKERETEIFTAYGILLLWWVGRRWAAALQRWFVEITLSGHLFTQWHLSLGAIAPLRRTCENLAVCL